MHCQLHLIRPLGFRMDEAALRRSAVGYLAEMKLPVHTDARAWRNHLADHQVDPARVWYLTKHGRRTYTEIAFEPGDWLVFGNESEGLPPEWLESNPDQTLRIPMLNPEARCLNLASSVNIVMFEALRQLNLGEVQE